MSIRVALVLSLVALGLVVPRGHADDREFAADLKSAGHDAKLDADGWLVGLTYLKSEQLTTADYERLGATTHLKHLTFYGDCLMTDAQAEQVGKLATLEELAINGTALSDEGFRPLSHLKELRRLTFWHLGWKKVAITGSGFAHLAECPKLESFGFGGSTIGDDGLKALATVKSLKRLELGHTRITEAGLAVLKDLPDLREVLVSPQFSMRLGDAGLATLATIPTLERISYEETMLTYDGGLKHLQALKGLKSLKMERTEVAASDLDRLKADLPELTIVQSPPDAAMLKQMREIQQKKTR